MTGEYITTQTGTLVLIQQEPQKIDKEMLDDLIIGQVVLMILILVFRFLYLITHPRKIKKIK